MQLINNIIIVSFWEDYCALRKKQEAFSMAIGNGELMHACFTEHLRIGKARMKQDKDTE